MSNLIEIDARFPRKLQFLFKPARYKVARGGRGSGKSWGFARAILLRCADRPTRVLCTREIQKSIQQSVHQLLSDQIEAMGLSAAFQVLQTEIRCTNGSAIYFSGLSDVTATALKSFEGVDIAWCEEAQAISAKSWKTLIPTIRKEGSEIWATYNPELESDPTHQMFVVNPPPDCVSILMNYSDNPYFPATLEAERAHAEKTMKAEDYAHTWEGRCKPAVTGAIYFDEISKAETEGRIRDVPHDPLLKVHAIWDLGWNDSMSIILAQRAASELRIIGYIEDSHRTLADYALDLKAMPYNWGVDYLPHDGFARDYKTGKTAKEILEAMGRTVEQTPNMDIEGGVRAARMTFGRIYIDKTKAARLVECLKRYRRHINKQTLEAGSPLHDEFSHGCLDGSTLITTRRGDIAIVDVVIGDEVLTPAGYALVTNSGATKIATEIIKITMDDGTHLLATPEHPIFTMKGVVRADALRYNDSILTMESAPCLSYQSIKSAGYRDAVIESFKVRDIGIGRSAICMSAKLVESSASCISRLIGRFTASLTSGLRFTLLMAICATPVQTIGRFSGQKEAAATRFRKLMEYGSISSRRGITRPNTSNMAASPCTGMFGKSTTTQYRKGSTFTTLMATRLITILRTLRCCLQATTACTTEKRILGLVAQPTKRNWQVSTIKLRHGTPALKVWFGIKRMARNAGKRVFGTIASALNVALRIRRLTQPARSIAPTIARLERVEGRAAQRVVYDLTIKDHHCYLANGLLVSNCDSFRYLALVADSMSNSNGSVKPIPYRKIRRT